MFHISRGFRGDLCDRMVSFYTPCLLIFASAVVFSTQYFGEPLTCFTPAQLPDTQAKYMHDMCWQADSYYAPLAGPDETIRSREISSNLMRYSWMVLLTAALLFYLPFAEWKSFSRFLGLNLDTLANTVLNPVASTSEQCFDKVVALSANQMENYLDHNRKKSAGCPLSLCGLKCRALIAVSYMFLKLNYVIIIALVTLLFTIAIDWSFPYIGISFILNYLDIYFSGLTSELQQYIPESMSNVVLCDVNIRELGNVKAYTIQCILNNVYLVDKLLVFVWFWFLLLTLFSVFNFFCWICKLACCSFQTGYVINESPGLRSSEFMEDVMKLDGRFVLKVFSASTDPVIIAEIANEIYRRVQKREEEIESRVHVVFPPPQLRPSGAVGANGSNYKPPTSFRYSPAAVGVESYEMQTDHQGSSEH
ncbi:innexin unc-9-like isoform X2 [Convolutriloba macropyga]|uniref:innexin unc-9-like isoform X2 n=1 Tax=Convolutriloba macropyga TaxID=536237 RepID=UPI003F51F14C